MSLETCKARLAAATPDALRSVIDEHDHVGEWEEGAFSFIDHAPTDLKLALDVIEAAKAVLPMLDYDANAPGMDVLRCALDAFEQAP